MSKRIESKRPSFGRDSNDMDDDGMHEGRLVTREELEQWGYRSIAEANAAIRAGRLRGPLIRGYTTLPIKWRGNILE